MGRSRIRTTDGKMIRFTGFMNTRFTPVFLIWGGTSITICTVIQRWKMTPNNPVFFDTSGWIILLNHEEDDHLKAVEFVKQFARQRRTIVTTDWVFAETGNGLAKHRPRSKFANAVNDY